ncbi:MAG: alpha/beta hydrolase [Fuerstiella sp.]
MKTVLCLVAILSSTTYADTAVEVKPDVVYSTVEKRQLLCDVYQPEGEQLRPAILVVHGGAWRSGNRKKLKGYAEALAKRGFVCFAIDYRLAPQHKFPAQIDDCRAAVKWIRQNAKKYNVDPARLGAIGYSAGGHLVTLLATTGEAASEKNGNVDTRLQAVAAGGAPTDFRFFPDNGKWAEYLMGGDLTTAAENFQAASAAAFADKDDAPTFFFNGTADKLVPVLWTQSAHEALKQAGVATEMHIIEGAGHVQAAMNKEALTKAFEFLTLKLKPTLKPEPTR